ncbi:ATP-binding protein [Algoriphagus sp. SE2]|uniref:ATP-binding protein n=1 Tax=Algoriphagus sp. SE2 TaxID=3141536 RepID=UPI0031CD516C
MKAQFFLASLFFIFSLSANAQEDVLRLKATDFDELNSIIIQESDLWLFTTDPNAFWSNNILVAEDWQNKNTLNFAPFFHLDRPFEGWFQIKLSFDESITSSPVGLNVGNFGQALEIFLDGKLIHKIGSLGEGDEKYQRGIPENLYDVIPLNINPNQEYVLNIHYKYEPVGFPANLFAISESFRFGVAITGPAYEAPASGINISELGVTLFSAGMVATILILLLMLLFQNWNDKLLWLLAVCITGFASLIATSIFTDFGIYLNYPLYVVVQGLSNLSFAFILPTLPLIFSIIFTGQLPQKKGLAWAFFFLCILEFQFLHIAALGFSLLVIGLGTSLMYIVRSRKTVKGAQWYVVIGGIIFLLSAILLFSLFLQKSSWVNPFTFNFLMLVFPLSLIGYVVSRFKEAEREVKLKSQKVIQITEEKRLQALNQKDLLEKEVKLRTAELSQSLENLKSTQAQLIHSEKMASLGELTAGIAHEIQNPLNFVNNFSEVNRELIDELDEEIEKGDLEEIKIIAADIRSNEQKINLHGKRADAIVKGMLEHSRANKGEKAPTDLNALVDEFVRLSYHGLRAKDKDFNADFKLELDPDLPKVNVVASDIGRVILNLVNNAFYAVNEKTKSDSAPEGYEPMIKVSSKYTPLPGGAGGGSIELSVQDNGGGIPEQVRDKIFQPFFTTKPTGSGTGLGLSLSYDIVKAHGGELKVESVEGEKTEFLIQLFA